MWEKTAMWEKAILMVGRRLEAGEFAAGRQPLPKTENGSTILLSNHPVLDPLTAPFYPSCHATENASAAASYESRAIAPRDRAIP
jgi:hypothetical protein